MNKLISINNLNFSYFETNILKNINLEAYENEKILLIGPNGAGKSTLLRVLSGFHLTRHYNDFNILGTNSPMDQFRGIAYLGNRWVKNVNFMGPSVYMADIKVSEMMKKVQQENIERRNELVELLEINLEWRMHQVSDGQRKKVQIMLGLLKPFKLLFIDEFTNDLDVVVRDNFFNYLDKECKARNACIIYATHIFDSIENWCTHVVYISNGKCQEKETIQQFNIENNLYMSVKNKILNDKNRNKEDTFKINSNLLGPQGGWSSGRSQNL
ncbi:ABC transporter [seawater metagenome]|uniref:ABC transporter n=1 Tax=seawater metagenome TaxID=1561972 RepID=A0A5E8CK90_9ZZZZ